MRLLLASGSPRRRDLLTHAGYDFDVLPVDVDETLRRGELPRAYVARLASAKSARAVETLGERANGHVILAADTVVVVDEKILGKPRDDDDARGMLRLLSGRAHQVVTGLSLRTMDPHKESGELCGIETTEVQFGPLSETDIEWYVSTAEGRDKAGAYAIQGLASRFVPSISGSYTNVVGLPVATVEALLRRATDKT
jgi:septum formation protein